MIKRFIFNLILIGISCAFSASRSDNKYCQISLDPASAGRIYKKVLSAYRQACNEMATEEFEACKKRSQPDVFAYVKTELEKQYTVESPRPQTAPALKGRPSASRTLQNPDDDDDDENEELANFSKGKPGQRPSYMRDGKSPHVQGAASAGALLRETPRIILNKSMAKGKLCGILYTARSDFISEMEQELGIGNGQVIQIKGPFDSPKLKGPYHATLCYDRRTAQAISALPGGGTVKTCQQIAEALPKASHHSLQDYYLINMPKRDFTLKGIFNSPKYISVEIQPEEEDDDEESSIYNHLTVPLHVACFDIFEASHPFLEQLKRSMTSEFRGLLLLSLENPSCT